MELTYLAEGQIVLWSVATGLLLLAIALAAILSSERLAPVIRGHWRVIALTLMIILMVILLLFAMLLITGVLIRGRLIRAAPEPAPTVEFDLHGGEELSDLTPGPAV
jgi:hypothetical protein